MNLHAQSENNSSIFERVAEIIAVAGNLAYTVLYLNQNSSCYYFAFVGSVAFAWLCFRRKIFAETGLHVFYMLMAIYGYAGVTASWSEVGWSWGQHLIAIFLSGVLTLALARYLKRQTISQKTVLDSFTTIFSLLATWLMVNYIHENWLYWIVIDAAAVYLYINRKMYIGAGLFALYWLMAIDGYFKLGIFF